MANTNTSQRVYDDKPDTQPSSLTYSMANLIGIFFDECEGLLQNLDASLVAVSNGEVDKDTIEIIFHSIHSVHEGATALGLSDLQNFAKVFDNTLNKMCSGQYEITHRIFQTLLQSSNMLGCIFAATRDNRTYNHEKAAHLMQELKNCIDNLPTDSLLNIVETTSSVEELNFQPIMLDFDFCNTPLAD